jgi:septal ring factor EnvC (AmiA/AmiB activator)
MGNYLCVLLFPQILKDHRDQMAKLTKEIRHTEMRAERHAHTHATLCRHSAKARETLQDLNAENNALRTQLIGVEEIRAYSMIDAIVAAAIA